LTEPGARAPLRPTFLLAGFFFPATAFLLAAAVVAIINQFHGFVWAEWMTLHLALLGGVSQLVVGAAQFFTSAFLATDPPPKWLVVTQIGVWNFGAVLVTISLPIGTDWLAEAGGGLIVIGLFLFAAGLVTMKHRSLQTMNWAVRWYGSSATFFLIGAIAGISLAGGAIWQSGSLLGAHMTLNLAGWLGTAIVGTLHTFFPSLTGTRLRYPLLERYVFAAWLAGVVLLASGLGFDLQLLAICGWLAFGFAAVLLSVNLIASLLANSKPLPISATLITAGQLFLCAGIVVGLISTLDEGVWAPFYSSDRQVLSILIVVGWVGMTVTGAVLHLMAILARVRSRFRFQVPSPDPLKDGLVVVLAGTGITGMAIAETCGLADLQSLARVMTLIAAVILGSRYLVLAARAGLQRTSRPGDSKP